MAAAVVAQIGDIKRFDSPRKLCFYAGLVPRVHNSGQTRRSGGITRTGRRSLRWATGLAAMSATRSDGPFKELRLQLCERRPKGVAMVARARRILVTVGRVWTEARPFAGQDEQRSARKLAHLDRSVPSTDPTTD
ncbi:MAG: IS110 family transposase [Armatimonadetes bacterium]|nr:IS110 family transposase [Armatimonadota bacterium]